MKRYLWIGMSVLLGGCSVQTVVPTTTEYRLEPATAVSAAVSGTCREKSLKIARVHAPDHYLSRAIYFGEGELKQHAYAYAKWVEPLQERMGELLQTHTAKSGIFANVFSYKTLVAGELTLQVELDELMQHYRDDGTSFVRFRADMLLLNGRGNAVVASMRVEKTLEVEGEGVESGIRAMNGLLEAVLDETAVWLGRHCE